MCLVSGRVENQGWDLIGEGIWACGGVCFLQVGPPSPIGAAQKSKASAFGGIEVEIEENTSKKDMG